MFLGMNARAYGIGLRNAAICGTIGFAVFIALYKGIQLATPLTGKDVTYTAFGILWAGLMLWLIINWWRNRQRGGEVLLEIGYLKMWPMFMVATIGFAIVGAILLTKPGFDPHDLAKGIFFITGALFYAYLGSRRTQFREEGIFLIDNFTPWEKIQTYELDGEDDAMLLITTPGKMRIQGKAGTYIPAHLRDEAERLLQERAPRNLTPADPAGVTQ